MFNPDNLYFINTPAEIQDEVFFEVSEQLQLMSNINDNDTVYLVFSSILNLNGKFCFRGYVKSETDSDKSFDNEPDFLIFLQN